MSLHLLLSAAAAMPAIAIAIPAEANKMPAFIGFSPISKAHYGSSARQSHHHLRRHRLDPHAEHVAAPADHARRDRRGGDWRGQGGRRDRAPAPARPEGRPGDAGPWAFPG